MSIAERVQSVRIWDKLVNVRRTSTRVYDKAELSRLQIFLKNCDTEYQRTEDWLKEEENDYVPVFVYCNMMSGGNQHAVIKNIIQPKNGNGKSQTPYAFTTESYEVWQTRDGPYSIPVALTSRAPKISHKTGTLQTLPRAGMLRGKIYFVASSMLNVLDNHKGNGKIHSRKKIRVQIPVTRVYTDAYEIPFTVEEIHYMDVWCYLGKHKYWDEHLDAGFTMEQCRLHDYRRPAWSKPSNKFGVQQPFYYFRASDVSRLPPAPKPDVVVVAPRKQLTTLELIEQLNGKPLEELLKERRHK